MALLEYCLANGAGALESRLGREDIEFAEVACLEHCGKCRQTPFLVVDGELHVGDSHDSLVDEHCIEGEIVDR